MPEQRDLHREFIEVYLSLFRLHEEGSMRQQVNAQELIDSYQKLLSLQWTAVFPELVTFDLSLAQVNVLFWLANRGVSTEVDVADQFRTTLSIASNLIDRLVQVGLAVRSEDSKGLRHTYVELTRQGKELTESLLSGLQQRAMVVFQALDEDDLKVLMQGFQTIIRVLGNASKEM
jgi:DNA-binding MarR family transcriptional regulator